MGNDSRRRYFYSIIKKGDIMKFNDLCEVLLSNDVYAELKEKEQELFELIPELKVCYEFNQNNKWHIYDVYEHILHVVSKVTPNKCLRIAALFHDIGKPLSYTEDDKGIGHFYGHWNKSLEIFNRYENKLSLNDEEIYLINKLIFFHDINLEKMNESEKQELLNSFGILNVSLLFDLKRSDLLAQNPEYHYLLTNIDNQEKMLTRLRK